MVIFLIIVILLIICWPSISRWLRRFLANRTEDYLRKATGMPPRPGSREERRRRRNSGYEGTADGGYSSSTHTSSSRRRRAPERGYGGPIIPPEYAEDVEFVETKNFSETTIGDTGKRASGYHESQVSDVEWVEVKDGGKKHHF